MEDKEARELNELVALKLGYTKWDDNFWNKDKGPLFHLPNYVGDMGAAWEIVERTTEGHWLIFQTLRHKWAAGLTDRSGKESVDAEADTAPEAIVRSFLKLP